MQFFFSSISLQLVYLFHEWTFLSWYLQYYDTYNLWQLFLFRSRFYLIPLTVSAQWLNLILQSLHVVSQNKNELLFAILTMWEMGAQQSKLFCFCCHYHSFLSKKGARLESSTSTHWKLEDTSSASELHCCSDWHSGGARRGRLVHLAACRSTLWMSHVLSPLA